MDTQKYNGWTNYATWMVNLHFEDFDFTDDIVCGCFDNMNKDELRSYLASWIQEYVDCYLEEVVDTNNSFILDVLNSTMQDVDWHDIADNYVDDILEQIKDRDLVAA